MAKGPGTSKVRGNPRGSNGAKSPASPKTVKGKIKTGKDKTKASVEITKESTDNGIGTSDHHTEICPDADAPTVSLSEEVLPGPTGGGSMEDPATSSPEKKQAKRKADSKTPPAGGKSNRAPVGKAKGKGSPKTKKKPEAIVVKDPKCEQCTQTTTEPCVVPLSPQPTQTYCLPPSKKKIPCAQKPKEQSCCLPAPKQQELCCVHEPNSPSPCIPVWEEARSYGCEPGEPCLGTQQEPKESLSSKLTENQAPDCGKRPSANCNTKNDESASFAAPGEFEYYQDKSGCTVGGEGASKACRVEDGPCTVMSCGEEFHRPSPCSVSRSHCGCHNPVCSSGCGALQRSRGSQFMAEAHRRSMSSKCTRSRLLPECTCRRPVCASSTCCEPPTRPHREPQVVKLTTVPRAQEEETEAPPEPPKELSPPPPQDDPPPPPPPPQEELPPEDPPLSSEPVALPPDPPPETPPPSPQPQEPTVEDVPEANEEPTPIEEPQAEAEADKKVESPPTQPPPPQTDFPMTCGCCSIARPSTSRSASPPAAPFRSSRPQCFDTCEYPFSNMTARSSYASASSPCGPRRCPYDTSSCRCCNCGCGCGGRSRSGGGSGGCGGNNGGCSHPREDSLSPVVRPSGYRCDGIIKKWKYQFMK